MKSLNWKHITDEGGVCTHEYDVLKIGAGQILMHHTANSEVTEVQFGSLKIDDEGFKSGAYHLAVINSGYFPFGCEYNALKATAYVFDDYKFAKKFAEGLVEMLKVRGIIAENAENAFDDEEIISGYVVNVEAQDAAVKSEIENASANAEKAPIENNLTVNVLAVTGKGILTLNGKRIRQGSANLEVWAAHDRDFRYTYAVLFTDRAALKKAGITTVKSNGETFKIVDFGRDEIPHVNAKVDAIISEYRAAAQKADEEKARRKAYEESDEGKVSELRFQIECAESELRDAKRFIECQHKQILKYQRYILEVEDEIAKRGIEIAETAEDLEAMKAELKDCEEKIARKNVEKAINAAAAEMADDGSNDDDEDTAVAGVEVEDEDDELADDLIIIKEEKVVEEYRLDFTVSQITEVPAAVTFKLERFGEDTPEVKELKEAVTEYKENCDAVASLNEKLAEINAKCEAEKEKLYRQITELENKRCREMQEAFLEASKLDSTAKLQSKVDGKIKAFIKGDEAINLKSSYRIKNRELVLEGQGHMSTYKTAEEFVDAIVELVKANKSGDTVFETAQATVEKIVNCAIEEMCGVENSFTIEVIGQNGRRWIIFNDSTKKENYRDEADWSRVDADVNFKGGKFVYSIEVLSQVLAEYTDVNKFVEAVRDFINAIKRGDSEYTFPVE